LGLLQVLTQVTHMLRGERAHRRIFGVLRGFLETLHIGFVHLNHLLDELLVELVALLFG